LTEFHFEEGRKKGKERKGKEKERKKLNGQETP